MFDMDTVLIQDSYKSIAAEAKGLFKDNGSRFIAHAYPVETEEEVKRRHAIANERVRAYDKDGRDLIRHDLIAKYSK